MADKTLTSKQSVQDCSVNIFHRVRLVQVEDIDLENKTDTWSNETDK